MTGSEIASKLRELHGNLASLGLVVQDSGEWPKIPHRQKPRNVKAPVRVRAQAAARRLPLQIHIQSSDCESKDRSIDFAQSYRFAGRDHLTSAG